MKNNIFRFIIPTLVIVMSLVFFGDKVFAFTHLNSQMGPGSTGVEVSNLQTFLASNGVIYPQGLVTGYYGALTQSAVNQFQIGYGMPPVGRVGPMTLLAANSLIDAGKNIDVNAAVISGVNVDPSRQSVKLSWNNSELVKSKVFYSTSPISITEVIRAKSEPYISGQVVSDATFSSSKTVTIPNLLPSTLYYYVIEVIDGSNNASITLPQTFITD